MKAEVRAEVKDKVEVEAEAGKKQPNQAGRQRRFAIGNKVSGLWSNVRVLLPLESHHPQC